MAVSKYQGIFSITGAIIATIALGNILPFSTLSSYITLNNNPNKYPSCGLFYFSISLFTSNLANIFSMTIAKITGTRILSLFGFVLIGGGYGIFYLQTNLFFHYIAMVSIGMGIGLQFNPMMRNIWLYYPKSKGLISIVFIFFYGLSAALFSLFIEFMFSFFYIDGELETAESKKEEILSNFFLITLVGVLSFGVIGLLLLTNHLPEHNEDISKQLPETLLLGEKSINDDNCSMSNYNDMEFSKEEPMPSTFLAQFFTLLFSFRFWGIVLMFFFSFIFSFLFTHSIRFLGIHNAFDSSILLVSVLVYPLAIAMSKIIISLLYNVIGFKVMFSSILIVQMVLGIVLPFVNNEYVFMTFVCIGGFCYGGNSSMLSPLIAKIYGIEHSFELSGFAIALSSLSVFVVPVVSLLCNESIEIELFIKLLFFGSVGTTLIALCIGLFISDFSFDFSKAQHQKLKKALNPNASGIQSSHQWLVSDVKSERNSN